MLKQALPSCATPGVNEAGCDEAGRGCLAGPVVAAAVILPDDFCHPMLNDSKKLTHAQRMALRDVITEHALAWAIGVADNREIDEINILRASITAMHRAVDSLKIRPGALAVDGNRFYPYPGIPHTTYVKGDGRFANIAAASILAKTYRDCLMEDYHRRFPVYRWDKNKGYPTKDHRAAIAEYGPCELHRMSFRLLDTQLTFNF